MMSWEFGKERPLKLSLKEDIKVRRWIEKDREIYFHEVFDTRRQILEKNTSLKLFLLSVFCSNFSYKHTFSPCATSKD